MDLIRERNFVLLFGLCLLIIVSCQQADRFTSHDPCSTRQTCHECIQTQACAWCSQANFEDQRCFMPKLNLDIQKRCSASYIFEPRNVYSDISSSIDEATETGIGRDTFTTRFSDNLAAITPQRVYLKLRVNDPYRMPLRYQQNPNYPVDLYYLMDLSNSMKDDKEKLYTLGNLLADTMKNITSDFRLGFGSFVDKVVMPYVSTAGKNLQEPCSKCAAPYGFQNVMSLDQNTSRFAGEVQNAQVSGNLDAPEGGFDAIMQAIVCRKEIGWRHKARKLLVFSTDAPFHYAGDGKLGGIVKPNDGCCHLDARGRYTHSTMQDYPSISQVNLKVKENSVNIIFAVTADQVSLYERLGKHVEGAYCGTLLGDSGNVVDLVKDQYSKITSAVEMKDTASKYFRITYYSKCLNQNGDIIKTNRCDGLKVNQTVQFEVEVEVTHCPPNPQDWKQTFIIYPVGVNETLTVMVEMQCDCPCEIKGHPGYEEHSANCSYAGTLKCGICECDPGLFGRKCECDPKGEKYETTTGLINGCRPDNVTDRDCSDHGTCICNRCECDRKSSTEYYYGRYCECDNFSCDRNNGTLCSDHGKCECNGMCTCDKGYTGNACECTTDTTNCIVPGTNEICSGKGECKCGVCKCIETPEGRYTGPQCQKCPTCPGKCPELKNCVQCKVHQMGPLTKEECEKNCTFFVLNVVDTLDMREDFCQYIDEEECRFSYVYYQDEKNRLVVLAQKRDCPPHVFILGFVFLLIGAIVLIGLALLLVWKLLTTIHDRREFAKFEKERVNAKWDTGENPIYKQATSTFKNPTYIGK